VEDSAEVDQSQPETEVAVKKPRKKRAKSSFVCHYCGYKAQSNPGVEPSTAVFSRVEEYIFNLEVRTRLLAVLKDFCLAGNGIITHGRRIGSGRSGRSSGCFVVALTSTLPTVKMS
jgi:hypothetical protein